MRFAWCFHARCIRGTILNDISFVLSICAAFEIGLVDNLWSDFHGVSMVLAFVAALVNEVCLVFSCSVH